MRRSGLALSLVAPLAAAALAACDGTTSLLAPGEHQLAISTGGSFTPGGTTAEALVGRWTRVEGDSRAGGGALTVETTFSFVGGGTGSRVVVTRTALGAVIAEDRQPFTWTAGAALVTMRIPTGTGDQIVRASFSVEQDVTGTTLRLDGQRYRRATG